MCFLFLVSLDFWFCVRQWLNARAFTKIVASPLPFVSVHLANCSSVNDLSQLYRSSKTRVFYYFSHFYTKINFLLRELFNKVIYNTKFSATMLIYSNHHTYSHMIMCIKWMRGNKLYTMTLVDHCYNTVFVDLTHACSRMVKQAVARHTPWWALTEDEIPRMSQVSYLGCAHNCLINWHCHNVNK